mmetsp:Transcript_5501/g.9467  ORF Transcript_5501/g.9467 Transcript_5501/m.9467 type:complete len:320 (+) Transcript_5501:690-1649(+)
MVVHIVEPVQVPGVARAGEEGLGAGVRVVPEGGHDLQRGEQVLVVLEVGHDVLRAVAVVHVEVHRGHAPVRPHRADVLGAEDDVVEQAEAVGLLAARVVPRRPHARKGRVGAPFHHLVAELQAAGGGHAGGRPAVPVASGVLGVLHQLLRLAAQLADLLLQRLQVLLDVHGVHQRVHLAQVAVVDLLEHAEGRGVRGRRRRRAPGLVRVGGQVGGAHAGDGRLGHVVPQVVLHVVLPGLVQAAAVVRERGGGPRGHARVPQPVRERAPGLLHRVEGPAAGLRGLQSGHQRAAVQRGGRRQRPEGPLGVRAVERGRGGRG